jgi:hypothetical protein
MNPYTRWRIGVLCLWAISATIVAVGLAMVAADSVLGLGSLW